MSSVREGIAKDGLDPNVEARAGLRDARDGTIKDELDKGFRETFGKTTAPRLSGKLADVFAEGLATWPEVSLQVGRGLRRKRRLHLLA